MKLLSAALSAIVLFAAGPAQADEAMAKKNGCVACHDMNKTDAKPPKIGPGWKEMAARTSVPEIIASIEKGSRDKFGKIPMPPQPKAKADAQALAKWIMSLK